MSKPWDSLRTDAPIKAGSWRTAYSTEVRLHRIDDSSLDISFADQEPHNFVGPSVRQLADFFDACAKQMGY